MPEHTYNRAVGRTRETYPEAKVWTAKRRIARFLEEHPRSFLAFSGGKDSIVVGHIMGKLGHTDAMSETSFNFERQIGDFKRSSDQLGLDTEWRVSLSWEWLERNQHFILPDRSLIQPWNAARQQRTVRVHAKERGYEGIIYGRRTEENTVPDVTYQTKEGLWHHHPLKEWTTGEVWAYIQRHGLHFPDLYNHRIGQSQGNCPYVPLPPAELHDPFGAIHDYDPTVVPRFAEFHEPAQRWLKERGL